MPLLVLTNLCSGTTCIQRIHHVSFSTWLSKTYRMEFELKVRFALKTTLLPHWIKKNEQGKVDLVILLRQIVLFG
ncbi:hypothetical protein Hdeb2414_s0020g00564711 [Helianthus debilis subsp. tardiflorus]